MIYGYLADLVVAVHALYVGYVVLGELVVLAGVVGRWAWVRNAWFRWTHLVAILIVALEALAGIACPLTVWESDLRALAGQPVTGESFVGRMFHSVLFYQLPSWVFTVLYVGFFLLVLGTLVLAPPRRRRNIALATDAPYPENAAPTSNGLAESGFCGVES